MSTRRLEKLRLLLPLILDDPVELFDRLRAKAEVIADHWYRQPIPYRPESFTDVLKELSVRLELRSEEILQEEAFTTARQEVAAGILDLRAQGPFATSHNADFALASLVYFICRCARPSVVVETGVAYGVTSTFILRGLSQNGRGQLSSIDLPPLGREGNRHVGELVPFDLRSRWHLHRGVSRRLLPQILPSLGEVDLFIHDSLHTYWNMKWEFETVWPFLSPGGFLIADDVRDNTAFAEFERRVEPEFSFVIREEGKDSLFGVLRKRYANRLRT